MFKLRTPYQIRVDPDCMEYDINEEAKYVFKTVRLTKEKLKYLFPDKKKLIDGFVKTMTTSSRMVWVFLWRAIKTIMAITRIRLL